MVSDHHLEFHELCDVPTLIVGSICIVHRNGYRRFPCVNAMSEYVFPVDGTPGTTTVQKHLGAQHLSPCTRVQSYREHEVYRGSASVADRLTEFIEALLHVFPILGSEFMEELVSELPIMLVVDPHGQMGTCCIVGTGKAKVL